MGFLYLIVILIAIFDVLGHSDSVRKIEELERQITQLKNEIKILKGEW